VGFATKALIWPHGGKHPREPRIVDLQYRLLQGVFAALSHFRAGGQTAARDPRANAVGGNGQSTVKRLRTAIGRKVATRVANRRVEYVAIAGCSFRRADACGAEEAERQCGQNRHRARAPVPDRIDKIHAVLLVGEFDDVRISEMSFA
jgi:hypothetical protein